MRSRLRLVLLATALLLLFASDAWAGTGGQQMPWNTPLQNVFDNLTGITGRTLAGFMIAIGGIIWGFTRNEEGAKRIGQAIIGIGFLLGAVSFLDLLGFQGAIF